MARLSGKTALVTGAAAGIGKAIVERFVSEGATVYATDIDEGAVSDLARSLSSSEVVALHHDVASETSWQAVMGQVNRRLDVLVNNAGIGGYAPLLDCTFDDWRRVMSVNLDGVFLGCRFGVNAMLGAEAKRHDTGGSIVNISSIYGLVGRAGSSAYSASKGGVRLLTKALALEAAQNDWGIRVNSVHPGFVETPLVSNAIKDRSSVQEGALTLDGLGKMHPIGRIAQPKEIADGVTFLASDESSFVTGTELVIDGGYTAI